MTDETAIPRVSVLMPCYNAERYIEQATRSMLTQTLRDFELIAIDDGSTDGTLAILRRLAAEDSRLRLVELPHGNIVLSLNAGLRIARADLLARMDADDVSAPSRLEKQVAWMDANTDVVLLGTRCLLIDPDGDPLRRSTEHVVHEEIERILNGVGHAITNPTTMFRRAAFFAAGGYREEDLPGEDLGLFRRIAVVGRLANLEEELLQYRRHYTNVTRTLHRERVGRDNGPQNLQAGALHARWARVASESGYRKTARKHAWRAWKAAPFNRRRVTLLIRTWIGR